MATTGGEDIDVVISPALTPKESAALRALRVQARTAPLSLEDSKRYNILQAKQLARMEDLNARLANQVKAWREDSVTTQEYHNLPSSRPPHVPDSRREVTTTTWRLMASRAPIVTQ
jgi:hypothetical protein